MAEQKTYPIELDRVLTGTNHEITDQDDREIDVKAWVSRGDFAGLVIEIPDGVDMLCLDLLGAIKVKRALEDAIMIMGAWED